MTITVTHNVQEIKITATYAGSSTIINPVICKQGQGFDGIVNGGTA